MSKEHPILMNGAMVRAVLDGRKQQTRRMVKLNRSGVVDVCPYGQPGDRLWVRESARVKAARGGLREIDIEYQADGLAATVKYPSRLAPAPIGKLLSNGTYREASRILLEITGVRVERLQDISEADALAEGINKIAHGREGYFYHYQRTEPHQNNKCFADDAFQELWESINGPGSWEANPWVWVIEFKVLP